MKISLIFLSLKASGAVLQRSRLARWRLCARSHPRVAGGRACVDRVSKSIKSILSNPSRKGSRGSAARAQMAAPATSSSISHSLFRLKFAILGHLWPSWSSSFFHIFPNRYRCLKKSSRSPKRKRGSLASSQMTETRKQFGTLLEKVFHRNRCWLPFEGAQHRFW